MNRLLAMLVMVGSLALVGCGGSGGPGDTVKDLMTAMEKGDAGKVKELAPGMKMLGDDKLEGMVEQMKLEAKKKGGIKDIEIIEEKIDGDKATVKYKVTMGDGTSDGEDEMQLIKDEGKWIVDMGDEGKPGGMGGPTITPGPDGGFNFPEDPDFPDPAAPETPDTN